MKPRAFALLLTLALGLLAAPLPAEAEKPGKVYRIGLLLGWSAPPAASTRRSALVESFLQGLHELGYTVGRDVTVEYRYAGGRFDRLPELAADLVRLNVDVFVTGGTPPTLAAKRATTTIPIVMVHVADPVGSGIVPSLARPGANITGNSSRREGFAGKWLELIREVAPDVSRVAVLWNPANPLNVSFFKEIQVAAREVGVDLQSLEARHQDDFKGAFEALAAGHAGALVVFPGLIVGRHGRLILNLVAQSPVPAIYPYRVFVDRGGLMFYGPSVQDSGRRAATYVDKIFEGAKPGDLPVERPREFEFVINMKAARALGL
ncbi:MAG: ABC transporter substrate-binding protein, partial [Anaerolineae bacterium]